MNRRIGGFTIFEMVIVLIMLGILTAGLAPLLRTQHTQGMEDANKKALNTARDVTISYALANGGLPVPLTSATGAATLKPEYVPNYPAAWPTPNNESYLPWDEHMVSTVNLPPLGISTIGSYRKYFWYDPRGELGHDYDIRTVAILDAQNPKYLPLADVGEGGGAITISNPIDPRLSMCANVRTAMKVAPPVDPRVCRLPGNSEMSTACPGGAAAASPAAFVIVSFGNDRAPDKAHASLDVISATPVRNYENTSRAVNFEHSEAPDIHYDDAVVSVSLAELANRCDQSGIACSADKRYLTVKNTSGGSVSLYYGPGGGTGCVSVSPADNARVSSGCLDSSMRLWTDSGCTVAFSTADTLATADTNGDGVAAITYDGAVTTQ